LKSQSYLQSAAFFDQLNIPFRRFGEDDIDFPWTLPLPNPVGEIPKMFVEQKEELRKTLFEMEEVLGTIDKILTEKDPRKAISLIEDLRMHIDGYGRITFSSPSDFCWDDFEDALKVHDRWRSSLEADGLLAPYIAMGEQLRKALVAPVESHPLTQKGDYLEADVKFDPTSLALTQVTASSGAGAARQPPVHTKGRIRVARAFDDLAPRNTKPIDYTIDNVWWKVMRDIIEDRYPDPEIK
jgi:hypothetical protein